MHIPCTENLVIKTPTINVEKNLLLVISIDANNLLKMLFFLELSKLY